MKKILLSCLLAFTTSNILMADTKANFVLGKQLAQAADNGDLANFKSLYEKNKSNFNFFERNILKGLINFKKNRRYGQLNGGKADSVSIQRYFSYDLGLFGLLGLTAGIYSQNIKLALFGAALIAGGLGWNHYFILSKEQIEKVRENIKNDAKYNNLLKMIESI